PTEPICSTGGLPRWYCAKTVTAAGCPPTTEPNFGTACAVEGTVCDYFGFMCDQQERVCSGGLWTPGRRNPCPISSRQAKKDIRYLSPDELRATAAQTLRLRLATYEYKAPPYAGRRHLGFIIEDSPTAPAVDRDGDVVDLYGYTSMLLAAAQAQAQQIEALKGQIESLSRTVERLSHRAVHRGTSVRP
ncbi:MAG: tail fiber domain-containing protein, partial [Myxococcales bacterium]